MDPETFAKIREQALKQQNQPPKEEEEPVEPLAEVPVHERTTTDHLNKAMLESFKLQIERGEFQLPVEPEEPEEPWSD